jgi:hypothetical protein
MYRWRNMNVNPKNRLSTFMTHECQCGSCFLCGVAGFRSFRGSSGGIEKGAKKQRTFLKEVDNSGPENLQWSYCHTKIKLGMLFHQISSSKRRFARVWLQVSRT